MERIRLLNHKGARIVFHDYSNLSGDALLATIREAASKVTTRGSGLNILTDVSGSYATREAMDELKALARKATPYVRKSAVIGMTGLKRILLEAVRTLTGRNIRTFNTMPEAMDWLAE